MGLDQWLMAKTKANVEKKPATGACSGLFGCVPTIVAEDIELCYIRKGYDQAQLLNIYGKRSKDPEDYTWHYSKEDIKDMLKEARRILKTHKFHREDGNDETYDDHLFSSDTYTWLSKTKWKDLIKGLKQALDILKVDPDADIYYHEWF